MKIVFFGTPDYVVPVLDSLHREFKTKKGESPIVAVVTQSPKPIGRLKQVAYSAVDTWAHKQSLRSKNLKKNIPVYFNSMDLVKDGIHADLGVVASYGEILSPDVLSLFPKGLLNIHPSDLPEFRGPSPVQAMIATGKREAVVSIMKVDAQMDHGPILSKFKEEIREDDTTEILRARLFERSAEVLTGLIPAYLDNKVNLKEQDDKNAIYTRLITKEHGFIEPEILEAALQGSTFKGTWKIPFIYTKKDGEKIALTLNPTPSTLNAFILALSPWPGAWTQIAMSDQTSGVSKKRLKIVKAHVENDSLIVDEVQLEGKNPVTWKQFKDAYPNAAF